MLRHVLTAAACLFSVIAMARAEDKPTWSMNATIIEACSCPMFCQCYFNDQPASHAGHEGHGGGHFCKFNNAYRINKGHYADVKLDGATFWAAGDLGPDLTTGTADWIVMYFDPSVTEPQRQAIRKIMAAVDPVQWKTFIDGGTAPIEWSADKTQATAKLDGGRIAEVRLKAAPGNTPGPVVIQNVRYFGAPRNEGFILMPNEIQTLRAAPPGQTPYEFRKTNGFMITFDINSNDLPSAEKK